MYNKNKVPESGGKRVKYYSLHLILFIYIYLGDLCLHRRGHWLPSELALEMENSPDQSHFLTVAELPSESQPRGSKTNQS